MWLLGCVFSCFLVLGFGCLLFVLLYALVSEWLSEMFVFTAVLYMHVCAVVYV